MKHRYAMLLLCIVLALMVPDRQAWGNLGDYVVTVGSSSPSDMTGATILWTGRSGPKWSGRSNNLISAPVSLGFDFRFDGTNYSQIVIHNSGIITLGSSAMPSHNDNRIGSVNTPVIASFWDNTWINGGVNGGACGSPEISYYTAGSAPNRVFIVRWKQIELIQRMGGVWGTHEIRLYEGTNLIEFYYDQMLTCDACGRRGCANTSGSIGLAKSPTNFLSLSPGTNWAPNSSSADNFIDLSVFPITGGTLIKFAPCEVVYTGRTGPGNGGTETLNNGDVFFEGFSEQMGTVTTFRPFELMLSNIACGGEYTMEISGAAAADYYFGTPGNHTYSSALDNGVRDTAQITFEATTTGVRTATLTVTGPDGATKTFYMSIKVPLVVYTGHIPEGGTPRMDANDTLLNGKAVWRYTSQEFLPFSITNVSLFNHNVTYTLNDPSGQYAISENVPLGPGETTTPTITFSPTGFGAQPARLTVTVGNESRSFLLLAISAAPGGTFTINGSTRLDSNVTPFSTTHGCVGDQTNSIPITVTNIGYDNFEILGVDAYRTDTTYRQGTPRYPFLRDAQGELIPSSEYILTETPPVLPFEANQTQYPILIPEGTSRTLYLTFVAALPNKRFGRVYIRTNGENFFGADTSGELAEGVVSFDVFGRGTGAMLSDNLNGGLPKSVKFEQTHLGESTMGMLHLVNPGVCTLRVDLDELIIDRGDVEEFEIVGKPNNLIDSRTNDLLIPPGMRDTVVIRFSPKQIGSRRAGIRLVTNDSTIQVPGITERGSYYIDMFGSGRADLYAEGVQFGQALIGGPTSEHRRGVVRMNNTRPTPVIIAQILIEGVDAAEFTAGSGWPTLPFILNAGQVVDLSVIFAPATGGQVGDRNGIVKLITVDGDTIIAPLHGIAGTRTVATNPSSVNFGILTVGKRSRQTITIANSGTMPLRLEQPIMSPGSDFTVGTLARLELAPGQVEYLEVTYTPSGVGASNGTLTINNNGTTGAAVINLSGAGLKTKFVDADPGRTSRGQTGGSDPLGTNSNTHGGTEGLNVSGVEGVSEVDGLALYQSTPNPAREIVEIRYRLAKSDEMALALYDGQGRLVRMLESGHREGGEGSVRVDVADLPNGVYHYRITSGGRSVSRMLRIVR